MNQMPRWIAVETYPVAQWTREEISLLRKAYKAGETDEMISNRLPGKTAFNVSDKRLTLQMGPPNHWKSPRLWMDEDDARVKEMWSRHVKIVDIAQILNRPASMVTGRCKALRLICSIVDRHPCSDGPVSPNATIDVLRRASVAHLIELKRAGHSPTRTELNVFSEGRVLTPLQPLDDRSHCGSQGAMCEGA